MIRTRALPLLTLVVVGVTVAASCGGDPPPVPERHTGELAYDVSHYDFAFDLDTRAATAKVTLEVSRAGDCVTIPFRVMTASAVTLDGRPVAADTLAVDGKALHACDATHTGFGVGASVVLAASFTVPVGTLASSQVGYNVYRDLEGNPFSYLVSWIGGCDRHAPCDARPDRFATYKFTVTHPSGTQVLCPGVVTAGDTSTTCDFALPGGPTYSTFGLAASRSWQASDLGTLGGLHVTLYDEPRSGTAAAVDKATLDSFITSMVSRFGPFPYGSELRYAVGPTYWWGFEHPGNIMLDDTLASASSAGTYARPLTHVMLHEMAHQWAGDQTTLASLYDFGWKESMVEYLTFVHEDEHLGKDVAAATTALWRADSTGSPYFLVPGDRPELFTYYGYVYGEGPMILFRQIEAMYSRDAVIAALRMVLGKPRALSIADVEHALEATTHADLSGYFAAWIYGTGAPAWPVATVKTTDLGGGKVSVDVSLSTSDGKKRGCAFDVRLLGAGSATYDTTFNFGPTGDPLPPITVTPGFAVTGTIVDPANKCLVFPSTGARSIVRRDHDGPGWRL